MKDIRLLQLYPRNMNIYGDWGNTLVLMRRLEWYGYHVTLLSYNPGDEFPENIDLVVGGGGQDSGQDKIQDDLIAISAKIRALADDGVPMLMICGLYQLFGNFFKTRDGHIITGIGILDIETVGGDERLIGNIVTSSKEFGEIIGYENHSGKTILKNSIPALGTVIRGAGNNNEDRTEGARYKNVIGTYLHGSLLPKNPQIADFLIEQAVTHRYGEFSPQTVIDDTFANKARAVAVKRPR